MDAIRDEKGRFKAGNKASTGRKSIAEELPFIEQLKNNVSPEAFGKIIAKLLGMCEHGNLEAMKILFPYLLGNPSQKMELTGKDGKKLTVNLSWEEADD